MESYPTAQIGEAVQNNEEPQYDANGMYLMPRSNLNVPTGQPFEMPEGLGSSNSIAIRHGKSAAAKLNPNDFEGYLQKYSPSMLKGWQKRYVILKDRKLYYKKTHEQPYPNGVLNFDHFQAHLYANTKDAL